MGLFRSWMSDCLVTADLCAKPMNRATHSAHNGKINYDSVSFEFTIIIDFEK